MSMATHDGIAAPAALRRAGVCPRRFVRSAGWVSMGTGSMTWCRAFLCTWQRSHYRRLRSWSEGASLCTYVSVVARRLALDSLRRRRPLERLDEQDYAQWPARSALRPEQLCWMEQRRRLTRAMLQRHLQDRARELLRRRFCADESVAEIAWAMGVSSNGVRVALSRALGRLGAAATGSAVSA